jgi:superfamily II DNA or RNA helicase
MNMPDIQQKISNLRAELARVDVRREKLIAEIACLEFSTGDSPAVTVSSSRKKKKGINNQSLPKEKVKLFLSLFRGRRDVYPRRFESRKTGKSGYQPACKNEWTTGKCNKPRVKCADCNFREYLPVTDPVIEWHLRGHKYQENPNKDFTIGIYPMLQDETCYFLAADFDKSTWEEDITAFRQICKELNVPVSIERSRSGNGAHAWIFFSEPVSCTIARKMGTYFLTETMERRPEIGFDSYDRFFPNQDTLPRGGLGNLIALPLQKKPREEGNSVFLDENLIPYPDQWEYLASVQKMYRTAVETLAQAAMEKGRVTGVRMPVTDDDDKPWEEPPSRKKKINIAGPLPDKIEIVLANQIFISKDNISPSLRNALIRVAAFQNPEFYQKQAMRMPTFNVPRIISCAENFSQHIALPRGCIDDVIELLNKLKIKTEIRDERFPGKQLQAAFNGKLYPEQQKAADELLAHENGILAATTAFGKTVVASYIIAQRKVNTLVLVHRRQLLEQWYARLNEFLDLEDKAVGKIGGGKRNPTGKIDVAIIQSLNRKGVVNDIVANYGHLVIDECHHISAPSFEAISREFKGKYVTGLSATVTRKDGHHPIIYMNCGPVRYKVSAKAQAKKRPFEHHLIVRNTLFRLPPDLQMKERLMISDIYSALMDDIPRNARILEDVMDSLYEKRFPVLLTERREHLEFFREILEERVEHLIVFKGGMGKKQLTAAQEKLDNLPEDEPRLIIATGRYLGEGFDNAQLDTLFLALPVSWKGTLAQYAGRLHRLHHNKTEVVIYDYADLNVPMLARMFERRLKGYRAIGYEIDSPYMEYIGK